MKYSPKVSQILGMNALSSDAISVNPVIVLARSDIEDVDDSWPTLLTEVIITFSPRVMFRSVNLDLLQMSLVCLFAILITSSNSFSMFLSISLCWSSFVAQRRKDGFLTLLHMFSM